MTECLFFRYSFSQSGKILIAFENIFLKRNAARLSMITFVSIDIIYSANSLVKNKR